MNLRNNGRLEYCSVSQKKLLNMQQMMNFNRLVLNQRLVVATVNPSIEICKTPMSESKYETQTGS